MTAAFLLNMILSAFVISGCAWLARRDPRLAGFVVSLPISTMLVLLFKYFQGRDLGQTTGLAKSIFLGLPLSMTFFIPFFLAERLRLSFWQTYGAGVLLIFGSYFVHRAIFTSLQGS